VMLVGTTDAREGVGKFTVWPHEHETNVTKIRNQKDGRNCPRKLLTPGSIG
jgi:hypothetical protein